ncbi:unnamed protein product [Bathycoccus prasinos]
MVRHNHDANVPPANAILSSEAQSELKREESDNARINADLANALLEANELLALKQSHAAAKSFKEANVPPEQRQPSPDSDDFDFEEGVGSTEGNSQTNDDKRPRRVSSTLWKNDSTYWKKMSWISR